MRLIFVCDKCKTWNELDYIRDGKSSSEYTIYEIENMGLDLEYSIETELEINDESIATPLNQISEIDKFIDSDSKLEQVLFRCKNCGDTLYLNF